MKVMEIEDEDGKPKYRNLAILAMNILLRPHINADPESFSTNNTP